MEIGGYFELEKINGKEYHHNLIGVNSGRNALVYLIKAHSIKKLYIPTFLCDTVHKVCEREGCEYDFYSIDHTFSPCFKQDLAANEWLYIVNYYGQLSNKKIKLLKTKYKNIIVDNVQAFFQRPVKNVDTLYSCRKFFGVPDGGYVSTNAVLKAELQIDKSASRMAHILGRFENTASEYYSNFQNNDESFYQLPLKKMSLLTKNILRSINYKSVQKKRNNNYKVLEKTLANTNKLNLITPVAPYCYPYYCENGMEIKRKLAEKKIYVPTLWPNVLELDGTLEKDFAENILPLPCDQRYTPQDMKKIADLLNALTIM